MNKERFLYCLKHDLDSIYYNLQLKMQLNFDEFDTCLLNVAYFEDFHRISNLTIEYSNINKRFNLNLEKEMDDLIDLYYNKIIFLSEDFIKEKYEC